MAVDIFYIGDVWRIPIEVGEYDDATGKVVSHQSYINLGLALDFQRKKEGEV